MRRKAKKREPVDDLVDAIVKTRGKAKKKLTVRRLAVRKPAVRELAVRKRAVYKRKTKRKPS